LEQVFSADAEEIEAYSMAVAPELCFKKRRSIGALLAARQTKGSGSNHRGRHYDDWQHRYPSDDPRQQPVNKELAERHQRQAGNSSRD